MVSKKKELPVVKENDTLDNSDDAPKQIDPSKFPNRIFILVEKVVVKHKGAPEYSCKLLSNEELLTAHTTYTDGDKYHLIAIPDIYKAGATNDAFKCLEYIGYWETLKNQK